jgi:hypothetical protein
MPLKKVAEVEICGERFDLAKNGRFTLVRTSPDAYGEPRGEEVDLQGYLHTPVREPGQAYPVERFRAVLDLLGEAYQALASARSMRLGGEPGDQP